MKKVFLDTLIKNEGGNNNGKINWTANIGNSVRFIYDNIDGFVKIVDCDLNTYKLTIEYDNKKINIGYSAFRNAKLGGLFGKNKFNFKYSNDEIIEINNKQFKILKQLKGVANYKKNDKGYYIKCLTCGHEREISEHGIINNHDCPICGDYIKFPEKTIISLLKYLNVNFEIQKKFLWSNNKRYDFYIPNLNCIIETNGLQHYTNHFINIQDDINNDKYKQDLAIQNGIINYINIDIRYSKLEYAKSSIINSELPSILNFDIYNIDWNAIFINSLNSKVKSICNDWNTQKYSVEELSCLYHLSTSTIQSYLKEGNKLNLCIYDKNINYKKGREKALKTHDIRKPVRCITTNEVFNSQKEASEYYGIYKTGISDCCSGRIASCGKHPDTNEKLVWELINL